MDKAALSRLLEEKVQEKLAQGYSIPTYAPDAASRDRVKRELMPQAHTIEVDNTEGEEWGEFLRQVENGTYEPDRKRRVVEVAPLAPVESSLIEKSSGSAGQWKPRRR